MGGKREIGRGLGRRVEDRVGDLARRQRVALLRRQLRVEPLHRRGHRHRRDEAGDAADHEARA
jgi:hypothetical protein